MRAPRLCRRITEMAAVLRAEKDPALFALWGSFVPPDHLVCDSPLVGTACFATWRRTSTGSTHCDASLQEQYQARLLSFQTAHTQRATALQPSSTLSELPGLRRERDDRSDTTASAKLPRFSRGA